MESVWDRHRDRRNLLQVSIQKVPVRLPLKHFAAYWKHLDAGLLSLSERSNKQTEAVRRHFQPVQSHLELL